MRLVVIGLGLVGGSLALALRDRGHEIVAVDDAAVLADPRARAIATSLIDRTDDVAVERALGACEVVVLATPVGAALAAVERALARAPLVTDVGSTKRAIVARAARSPRAAWFVPGHPMAGAPRGGLEHARADLFVGRRWLLCPEGRDPAAIATVERLIREVGAAPQPTTAEEHDRQVALVSHVPQLVASALAAAAVRTGASAFAGPSFESATRVAGGPERMWLEILETNRDRIAEALGLLEEDLGRLRVALSREPPDLEACAALLRAGRWTAG